MTYYMYAKLYFEYVRTCKKNSTHFCATGQAATVFFFFGFTHNSSSYNSGGMFKTYGRWVCSSFLECVSLVIAVRVAFVTWINPYCCRLYTDLNMVFHLCLRFFHIAAVNTRDWTCCSIYTFIFFSIRFQHRKRSSSYWLPSRGRVSLWPLSSIHFLMWSDYARVYCMSYFGYRINAIFGKITSLFLLVVGFLMFQGTFYRTLQGKLQGTVQRTLTGCHRVHLPARALSRDGQVIASPTLTTPPSSLPSLSSPLLLLFAFVLFFWDQSSFPTTAT